MKSMVASKNFPIASLLEEIPIASPLQEILVIESEYFSDREFELDRVFLVFSEKIIDLTPNDETDEIDIEVRPADKNPIVGGYRDRLITHRWSDDFIGQKLQTVWICENAQGYRDQIIFAFGVLHPSLIFLCEGSAITVFRSEPIYREQPNNPNNRNQGSIAASKV